ncbi:Hypothetical predicted protein [Paramuricea clavata]|uniref:Uncharacterized protein n=1 Tax=Paramuricea clavata TaxID=317549 RepID=A0A6S7HD88_PARCT|nr:Hypothetical predicted protein [Paramuricea clavata]
MVATRDRYIYLSDPENILLKEQNGARETELARLKSVLTELNAKLKTAEIEKARNSHSLLNDEQAITTNPATNNKFKNTYQTQNPWIMTCSKASTQSAHCDVILHNRYSILHVEDGEGTETIVDARNNQTTDNSRQDIDQRHCQATKQKQDAVYQNRGHQRHSQQSVIVGDSILKHLNPRKIGTYGINGKANIKTFPGASIEDMLHYVKPTIEKQFDHIILHIGTNNH